MIASVDVRLIRWGDWVRSGAGLRLSYPSIATELRGVYGASGFEGPDPISEETDLCVSRLEKTSRNLVCDWYVGRMSTTSLMRLYRVSRAALYVRMHGAHAFIAGAFSTISNAACV